MVTHLKDDGTVMTAAWDDRELFRYTYRPNDPGLESPRPFFHPVRTLKGDLVTLYRPHDHVWHKGIAWSLPNVGPENFWGGPTYRRGEGYVQLPNNGTMRHDSFSENGKDRLREHLTWVTESGHAPIAEHRRIAVTVWPDDSAWRLAFRTTMRNLTDQTIALGSPTTEGAASVPVVRPQHPYACVSPAPFFGTEYPLPAETSLTLRYDIVIADGARDAKSMCRAGRPRPSPRLGATAGAPAPWPPPNKPAPTWTA
jgi:hypothetical protein